MKVIDLYDLNNPRDFYRIIQKELEDYCRSPTEKGFLLLALGFTHLREWIAEGSGHDEIKKKLQSGVDLTKGERFFVEIFALESFKVVSDLCNRSKHFIKRKSRNETSKDTGFCVGHGRAGDNLNQTYFLIDGKDSRDHFYELSGKYNEWLANNN